MDGTGKSCNEWNTIVEVVSKPQTNKINWQKDAPTRVNKAQAIGEISLKSKARIDT